MNFLSINIKNRILIILIVASLFIAAATGAMIVFLIKLHGQVSFADNRTIMLTAIAIAVYLVGGLFILGLLSALLSKRVIIPAVEKESLEREREMLTEQLHHAQKMEAVGRLAGSIAHDFNNLLTIIDGYASLIIANPEAAETVTNAQEVVEAGRKASFITRKLLSFSHKEQAEPVVLNLNTTLTDTDKMLSRLIGEKIRLVSKISAEKIYVRADSVQLGQVLMNLTVNARDAMPNGGRITIKTELQHVDDGEHRKPSKLEAGVYALISVKDTGEGIPADTIDRIFEPFFTTKEAGKGTGLGLSIVQTIIKQFDGFIDINSKAGGGTTFMIFLPLAEVQAEELDNAEKQSCGTPLGSTEKTRKKAPQSQPEATEADKSRGTILLVEDDPMIRGLVSQTLEGQSYNVLLADDGWTAVQVARKYSDSIDLLFTDVVMPGLGGAELALAVRELYPNIKSLFMSGYSRVQVTEEGVPADAALLEKPFTPSKVIEVVNGLLDG